MPPNNSIFTSKRVKNECRLPLPNKTEMFSLFLPLNTAKKTLEMIHKTNTGRQLKGMRRNDSGNQGRKNMPSLVSSLTLKYKKYWRG